MKYHELYLLGKKRLTAAGIGEAELDARLLLEAVCKTGRHDLTVNGERAATGEQEKCYLDYIARRESRLPLQYITGEQEFMGLKFHVSPDVLIPRQDTETLVGEVRKHLRDGRTLLDLCTGSGCILLSLLYYSPECRGVGADISAAALKIAAGNEERIRRLPEVKSRIRPVTWLKSDLFTGVNGRFDIITANPPYICAAVLETLMPEVRDHEPRLALDGKEDGLYFLREIIDRSCQYLRSGGYLFLETGYDQAEAVTEMMKAARFLDIKTVKDLSGNDRVVYGRFETCFK